MTKFTNITPKTDFAFKYIFSKKGNEHILKDFLSSIISNPITKIAIKPDVSLIKTKNVDKLGILDLIGYINENTIISLEVQNQNKGNIIKRSQFYASKIISSCLKTGEEYDDINSVILINLLNYNMNKRRNYITESITVAKDDRNFELAKSIKYIFIELPKFRKLKPELGNKLHQWLIFLDYRNRRMIEMVKTQNEAIKKADEAFTYLTGEEEERRLAELREKYLHDIASLKAYAKKEGEKLGMRKGKKEGREEGIKEGMKEGERVGMINQRIRMAKKMLEDNADILLIEKYTGLTRKEILQLK